MFHGAWPDGPVVKNVTADGLSLVSSTTLGSLQLPITPPASEDMIPSLASSDLTHKAHSHVNIKKKIIFFRRRPGMVLYAFNSTTLEAEVGKRATS